jgi:hypothetical protein
MTELIAAGGCYNCMRFALDGAGVNLRDWRGAIDTTQDFSDVEVLILAVCFDADDMNVATDATFKIQWRNISDAGSWTDLASTGEIKWGSTSDLVDDASLASAAYADSPSSIDCVAKGWTVESPTSQEVEGANGKTMTVSDDDLHEIHWAIALDSADAANADQYEFRVTDTSSSVIGTGIGKLNVFVPGKIDGTTKNATRSSAVGGVTVSAFVSDGAGSDAKPEGALVSQVVSHASTGVYSLTGLASGIKYFLHFYKDDTADVSDGSPEVTAVDL